MDGTLIKQTDASPLFWVSTSVEPIEISLVDSLEGPILVVSRLPKSPDGTAVTTVIHGY